MAVRSKPSRHAARGGALRARYADRAALPCSYLLLTLLSGILMILFDRNPARNDEYAHWCRVKGLLSGQVHALADPNGGEGWGGIIDGTFQVFNNTAVNSPFVYWPSLLSGGDYRAACMLTLCAAALTTAIAIALAGDLGCLIAGTAILPMVFYSYLYPTADAITNSYAMLYIGYILYLCRKERLGAVDYVVLTVASVLLGQIKSTCLVLVLLLIVPALRRRGAERLLFAIPMIGAGVSAVLWMRTVKDIVPAPAAVSGERLEALREAMMQNPLLMLKSMVITLFQPLDYSGETVNGLEVNSQRNMQLFAGSESPQLGMAVMLPVLCATALLFLAGAQRNRFRAVDRVVCGVVCVAFFGLTCVAMVLTWSGELGGYAGGIQTRYFIPVLPLVGLMVPDLVQIRNRHKFIACVDVLVALSYCGLVGVHCVSW